MSNPCTRDATPWTVGDSCTTCGHAGWFHKGGGAGKGIKQCMICNLLYLEAALIQREQELRERGKEADLLIRTLQAQLPPNLAWHRPGEELIT